MLIKKHNYFIDYLAAKSNHDPANRGCRRHCVTKIEEWATGLLKLKKHFYFQLTMTFNFGNTAKPAFGATTSGYLKWKGKKL